MRLFLLCFAIGLTAYVTAHCTADGPIIFPPAFLGTFLFIWFFFELLALCPTRREKRHATVGSILFLFAAAGLAVLWSSAASDTYERETMGYAIALTFLVVAWTIPPLLAVTVLTRRTVSPPERAKVVCRLTVLVVAAMLVSEGLLLLDDMQFKRELRDREGSYSRRRVWPATHISLVSNNGKMINCTFHGR